VNDLENSRREFEETLEDVHSALEQSIGWAPRAKAWVLPLFAAGVSVAAALWLRRGQRLGGARRRGLAR
jgi:hypothetical protein